MTSTGDRTRVEPGTVMNPTEVVVLKVRGQGDGGRKSTDRGSKKSLDQNQGQEP